jgi:hypothetical protein
MADVIHGIVSDPSVRNIDEPRPIPITRNDAVRVEIGGGLLAAGAKSGSGRLVGAAGAVFGYAADKGDSLVTSPIQYPRGGVTTNLQLSIFVTTNSFTVAGTTFTVYKNGVATADTIVFAAGVAGLQTAVFALGFAAGNTFDLRVDNPGNVADVGKAIEFGYSADFF